MYNESVKKAVCKYQSKFKKVQLLISPEWIDIIEANEPNKQAYIKELIRADLVHRGLLKESE